jgi:hypothetical protein
MLKGETWGQQQLPHFGQEAGEFLHDKTSHLAVNKERIISLSSRNHVKKKTGNPS